ncbi:hypothetical protein RhiJN_05844 [Ceratobasidium sp. AG-Ba]|nr:hypothetical protein RhiJN_05844 [Ceratobasidium sp. AG-Ba]QRW06765.1 hypothetical protein RhiLY_05764 [Ceratobasidium sp. AG-Ba]
MSPGEGPWPYSRDASLERPVDVLDKVIEPVPEANLNKPAVDDPNPYDYLYDETPTLRVLREVDGKRACERSTASALAVVAQAAPASRSLETGSPSICIPASVSTRLLSSTGYHGSTRTWP